jgi:hypothetical protein
LSDYSINEGSTALINLWFKDENEKNIIPTSLDWYLNDATYYYASGSETPTSYKHELVIPSSLNLLNDRTNLWEEKILTVLYRYGASFIGTDEFRYQVKRLDKINTTEIIGSISSIFNFVIDGPANIPSLRTLGTGATQACAGNDSRLGILDTTYSSLVSMASGGTLLPGQKYRITDFRTRHLIPNTLVYNEGPTEVLIVEALTASTLKSEAKSESYPQDIIHYELVQTHKWNGVLINGGDRGWIYYREDPIQNNKLTYDFRNCKWRRWNTLANGLGTWTVLTDNTFPYQDFYTFITYSATGNNNFTGTTDNYNGPNMSNIFNNVFLDYARNNGNMQSESYGNTFVGRSFKNNFGCAFALNVFYDECVFNEFVDNFYTNSCLGSFYGNKMEKDISGNIFNWFQNNIVGDIINGCTFENDIQNSVFRLPMSNVTIPSGTRGEYKPGYSNITGSMDWFTSVSMFGIPLAGVVTLLGAGGTFSTSSITNFNTNHPVTFIAQAGYTFTFTHTLYANITAHGQIMGQADIVLVGNQGDRITLEVVPITNLNGTFNVLVRKG